MNLNENINRIKQVMGLLNEQTEKVIEVVKGTYTATNCDELHAFEGTCPSRQFAGGKCVGGTKLVGEMNTKMLEKLNALYENGHNPKVSNVGVSVEGMIVTWTCTIVESTDGKAWMGLTSRGAGCNNDIVARAESASASNDKETIIARINELYKEPNIEIEKVNDFTHDGGGNSFRQIFYRYTKPLYYPPHKSNTTTPVKTDSAKQIVPIVPSVGTTGTQSTADIIQTNNTTLDNQTTNSSSTQQTNTVPQQAYNYPDMSNPFKPTNGDPWQYAYDGTKLLVKSPTTGNVFNLLDSNYFKAYPNSKLNTPEKLDNAKSEIKRLYGSQLGYK
jgi:hypothetical protein